MRRFLLYLFLALTLLAVTSVVVILFVPSASRYLVEQSARHYLGHTLSLRQYHITPTHLYLDGTFEENSSIELQATDFISSRRTLQLHFVGKASFFNSLLDQNLSNVPLQADLHLAVDKLNIQAHLLDGFIDANASLKTMAYRYTLTDVDIPQLIAALQMPEENAPVTAGILSAEGSGVGGDSHESIFTLNNIKAPDYFPSSQKARIDGKVALSNATLLKSNVIFHSKDLNADIDNLLYDLQSGLFSFSLAVNNRDHNTLPFRHIMAMGSGESSGEKFTGTLLVEADTLQCLLNRMEVDIPQNSFHAKYRLTTLSHTPFNLVGQNALYGRLAYAENALDADAATKSAAAPLLTLRYSGQRIRVISKKLPLPLIASITNRKLPVTGTIDANATVKLNAPYPVIALDAVSPDMAMIKAYADASGMTGPLNVNLKLSTLSAQHYKAEMRLHSDQLQNGSFTARFDPKTLSGDLQGNIARLTTRWYEGSDIALQSEADFEHRTLRHTEIATDNETVSVPRLDFGDDIHGTLFAAVKRLDRFFPSADPALVLDGNATFTSVSEHSEIDVAVQSVGKARAVISAEGKSLSADGLDLAGLFALAGQTPAPLSGTAALRAALDSRSATLRLTSEKLTPSSELNSTLRPFPLDINATLLRCGPRYFGEAEARTGGDRLVLSSLDFDTADNHLSSYYRVEIADENRSALLLPASMLVLPLEANGKLALSGGRSKLSLHTARFALGKDIHRVLERNATGALPLVLDMNLSHSDGRLSAGGEADARPAFLLPFALEYNATSQALRVDASERSADENNETLALHLQGTLKGEVIDKAELSARTERFDLDVHNLHLDTDKKNYRGDFRLGLIPQNSRYTQKAYLIGTVRTRPQFDLFVRTSGMEGNLSAVMNEDLLILHAADLSLPHILGYVQTSSPIEDGIVSGNVILNAPPLLENNLSRLSGGVDLHLDNVVVLGSDIDDRLQTLQDTQDFSLFQGSLFEMPLVRSVVTLPETLFVQQKLKSRITQARLALAVSEGKAVCVDCAAATPKHRVAAAGDINLATRRFDAFYVALLNPKGCPYYMQRIRGPLNNPHINLAASGVKVIGGAVLSVASNVTQAANFLTERLYRFTSATGDVISYVPVAGTAVDSTLNSVSGSLHDATEYADSCTPFYLGSIPAPKK